MSPTLWGEAVATFLVVAIWAAAITSAIQAVLP